MNAENLFVGGFYEINGLLTKLDSSILSELLVNNKDFKVKRISLFENEILEKIGYRNINYGYEKSLELDKIIRLITADGWVYPQIEQCGEMSHQEVSIVSFERIKFLDQLHILEKVFGKVLWVL